ncbi:hypothetical protein TNIN_298191 [Trichonephila inaurata madagascariensis]|uniref:Uncharacterized protein n=1 Tax=Trichonephila inaurata madagascariensis TaxID=2747483 RepID=A0A8X7CK93_9ARAC|nr:hypothetical protein TNIN_298191 [Trichonephila inaurata madagascariensis]
MVPIIKENTNMLTSTPLTEDWISYEIEIGKEEKTVTPINCITLTEEIPKTAPSTPPPFLRLLLLYRTIAREKNEPYYNTIVDKLHSYFVTLFLEHELKI